MHFSWQFLGAFVSDARCLTDDVLDTFMRVGGRWIAVNIEGDDDVALWNRLMRPDTERRCRERNILYRDDLKPEDAPVPVIDPGDKKALARASRSEEFGVALARLDVPATALRPLATWRGVLYRG